MLDKTAIYKYNSKQFINTNKVTQLNN